MIEDTRPPDRTNIMTRKASDFFMKVLKSGVEGGASSGGAMGIGSVPILGLLTNTPAAQALLSTSGTSAPSTDGNTSNLQMVLSVAAQEASKAPKVSSTATTLTGTSSFYDVGTEIPNTVSSTSTALTTTTTNNNSDNSINNSSTDVGDVGDGYDPLAGRTKGLGRLFLQFTNAKSALVAQQVLSGRSFAGRIIATSFVDENSFISGNAVDFERCFK
jgi:hypothetical protein